jgi:hypothetical protein
VISDAAATGGATVLHMTEPDTPTAAAHAWASGLDVVFQSSWPEHRPFAPRQRARQPDAEEQRAEEEILVQWGHGATRPLGRRFKIQSSKLKRNPRFKAASSRWIEMPSKRIWSLFIGASFEL